jgi:hypothetical protein
MTLMARSASGCRVIGARCVERRAQTEQAVGIALPN